MAGMATEALATGGSLAGAMTPLILTLDEAPNIGRCLERLTWAARVIVLDSGSTDDTVAIARRFPNVDVHERPFDDYATQRNHGLSLVTSPWVLSLDADYVLPPEFPAALDAAIGPGADVDAVRAGFRYCIFGRPLRGSLYPPRPVAFRRDRCRYDTDGHAERLIVTGREASVTVRIDHDDRKPIDRWFRSQVGYTRLEADKLLASRPANLNWPDRLRRTLVFGPPGVCLYTLIVKGALFDGWPGWYYTLQRGIAETMLSLELLDRRLRRAADLPR
jgi:glycosyltransferase involved in cell wall biosynthesis